MKTIAYFQTPDEFIDEINNRDYYNKDRKELLNKAYKQGFDMYKLKLLADTRFDIRQAEQIYDGFNKGLSDVEVETYANYDFYWKQMEIIKNAYLNRIDKDKLNLLLNKNLDYAQIKEINQGIQDNIDFNKLKEFSNPSFNWMQMHQKRTSFSKKQACIQNAISKFGEIEKILNNHLKNKTAYFRLENIYFDNGELCVDGTYKEKEVTNCVLPKKLTAQLKKQYNLTEGDKMKRLISSISPKNPYELYKSDLNWHDDGNDSPSAPGATVEDPSMNDYIKGYKYDPYEMRYWAKIRKATRNPKRLMKIAWKEVDVLQFTPEYLADKILKLWNQMDGTLQNAFEGFTLRYDNKLKQEIADIINQRGYEVYPILLVDAPMYGVKLSKINKAKQLLKLCKKTLPTVATVHLASDLQYIQEKEHDLNIVNKKAQIMYDYYSQLFPQDYSLSLITNYFKPFVDLQISDIGLEQMEKMDSENQESLVLKDNGFDAYDFVSDMRYDTTEPNVYEVNNGTDAVYKLSSRLKKKITADEELEEVEETEEIPVPTFSMPDVDNVYEEEEIIEEEIEFDPNNKIPNEFVFDVLNEATNEIVSFTGQTMLKPPVPVAIYIREDDTITPDSYSYESEVAVADYLDVVYTIYEFFLSDRSNVFAIIQADRLTPDHKFYEWGNVQYKGFYQTEQEAANYLKAYL